MNLVRIKDSAFRGEDIAGLEADRDEFTLKVTLKRESENEWNRVDERIFYYQSADEAVEALRQTIEKVNK